MNAARLFPATAILASAVLVATLLFHDAFSTGARYWSFAFARDTLQHTAGLVLLAAGLRFWLAERAVALLTGLAALYLFVGIGPAQSLGALLFYASSLLLGRQLLTFMFPAQAQTATAMFFCGMAAYLTLFGIMIHFPVNYRAVYLVLLAAPLAAESAAGRMPAHWQGLVAQLNACRGAAQHLPYAIFTTGVLAAVLLARFAFLPTLGFDDNALHLGLWSQLKHEHVYGFDYVTQIWEVAPFVVDLLHAAVNLAAGTDARGATNVLLLAVLLHQLWVIAGHLQLDTGKRLLLLALFISTPITGYLLMTLQAELFVGLLAIAGIRLALELRGDWCGPNAAALIAIAALCCAAKLPGAWLGILLCVAALQRLWSTRRAAAAAATRSIVLLAGFTLLLSLLAFNAYVTAWLKTGNPVFPLYNGIFQSPHFGAYNFTDSRWTLGFSPASYWNMFFNTSAYYESQNFVAGFQYLLLLPLGLGALLSRARRQDAFALCAPLLGFGVVMFAAVQYWRYLFPVLPVASIVIGALLALPSSGRGEQLIKGSILLCIVLNLLFYPGITGFMGIAPGQAYTARGKQETIEQFIGPRALTDWINANAPGSRVLYPEGIPYGATLDGTPIYATWYAPTHDARFHAIRDEADGMAFMRDTRIDYVIAWMNDPAPPGTLGWGLRRFLARVAEPVAQVNDYILYRFANADVLYQPQYELEAPRSTDTSPTLLASVATGTATAIRYRAEFACGGETGYFVAQINWNNGQYYYHRIPCASGPVQFVESAPIPAGASGGDIYISVNDAASATLTQLSVETH